MSVGPINGQCLCGGVRLTAWPRKVEMDACHCGTCRRWSGGVFLAVPCERIEIADESTLGLYASSEWGERGFCFTCGSSLFWRMQDGSGDIAVSTQLFESPDRFLFAEEIFIDHKPSNYEFAGERKRLTADETIAQFNGMQEG
ncbi:GFA family protein [Aureimonas psammosilenae]|uniref:GFA family protein n=1 Tax=Aureimonas psammosilenae TaxID=2495496 RepID=UPI001260CD9C|nr:GFA family protein [Aureimonas psammosilenae]